MALSDSFGKQIGLSPCEFKDLPIRIGATGFDLRGTDPVSYTHLRAHETVLDLVCRLLLEKKNTTQ